MITAQWLINQMEEWAPEASAEDWDNIGLIIGDAAQPVKKVLVALDVTEEVMNEALVGGFDFIITHHPLIYNPIKRITSADSTGRKILTMVKNGIGCFCAHTNLDKAVGGVNDCIAEKIGLEEITGEEGNGGTEPSLLRFGYLPEEMTLSQLAAFIKTSLALSSIRFSGKWDKNVKKIGLCGGDGSGGRYIEAAIRQKCDVYITGDLRYHCVQEALESGIAFLDITHYGGEILVVPAIVSRLKKAAGNAIEILPTSINGQVFNTL